MKEYKCISCGEVKQGDERCTCPVCGYSMYEMPYERAEILRREIVNFIKHLIVPDIQPEDVIFKGKAEDDARFPGIEKIHDYIFYAEKTEQFYKRMTDTVSQLKKHLHESFRKQYSADLTIVKTICNLAVEKLIRTLEMLGIETEPEPLILPEITLEHSEVPDETALYAADMLLDRTAVIAEKIYKFIVKNNLYTAKRKAPDTPKKSAGLDEVPKCLEKLDKVIAKKYVVDILDDGSAELSEMLRAYWQGVSLAMRLPVLQVTEIYTINGVPNCNADDLQIALAGAAAVRFDEIKKTVLKEGFLSDKTEDKLFELYDEMLVLDTDGIMKAAKGVLLKTGNAERKLEALIGLAPIKESIKKIKAYALANKNSAALNLHMCFLGNPGTGKTETARIIAGILHENGLLPTDNVIETDRSGLVAGYVGQTAIKTAEKIEEAMGGVLFIDEAYSLVPKDTPGDYGLEAIAELIKQMEDRRGKFCVIFAGYKNPMQEMLTSNQGLRSRIQFTLDFPNYSREELQKITELMLRQRKYSISERALDRILDITDIKRKSPDFANAREIRNILEQVIMCQNLRCVGTEDRTLEVVDVNKYISDNQITLPTSGEGAVKKILTADEELDALVGLVNVKRMIKKIRAYAKRNKTDSDFNLHMCFCGNPATGKTETARILSRIFYEAGVLPEAKLVETDAHGLMGKYVGETAPKTLAKINEAMGGVLFIDEAYAFTEDSDGKSANYGDEAIAVLLKEMEDRRGQFCVIFAGYTDEMKAMISSNPGLESRIQFTLDFPDYTREELSEIALRMLEKKKYTIADNALSLLLDVCEYYRRQPDFANARTVRNLLDQVILNQNLRADEEGSDSREIVLSDVEDYIADEGIDLTKNGNSQRKIGF